MSKRADIVPSSPRLREIAATLTEGLNRYDLTPERNVVVHVFDEENTPQWREYPSVWHTDDGSTFFLNLAKLYQLVWTAHPSRSIGTGGPTGNTLHFHVRGRGEQQFITADTRCIESVARALSTVIHRKSDNARYRTYLRNRINPDPLVRTHTDIRYLPGRFSWNQSPGYPEFDYGVLHKFILGALLRESGYAVFNQQIRRSEWYDRLTPYRRNIVTVLEELRVERQQIARIDGHHDVVNSMTRRFLRSALSTFLDVPAVLGDMSRTVTVDGKSGIGIANLALNSSLILGREDTSLLLPWETKKISSVVDTVVGTKRLADMHKIWDEYSAVVDGSEAELAPLVERWEALFPSESDGSAAESSTAPAPAPAPAPEPGTADEGGAEGGSNEQEVGTELGGEEPAESGQRQMEPEEDTGTDGRPNDHENALAAGTGNAEDVGGANDDGAPRGEHIIEALGDLFAADIPTKFDTSLIPDYTDIDGPENGITPSRKSYAKAQHRYPSEQTRTGSDDRTLEPSTTDRNAARRLARELENLNTYDRGKFVTQQVAPPGRLRTRAALQQTAERVLDLPETAAPWRRTRHTVDMNPPVTVGIMTDVSGSMAWAERLSARLAWIVQHAVTTIHGRTAALAFGRGVTITLRPGEHLTRAQIIPSTNPSEDFDGGAGTMDVMLDLVHGTGTRVLVVVTDGNFVRSGMMERAHDWIEILTSKGVHVVWITPMYSMRTPESLRRKQSSTGFPYTPEKAIPVSAMNLQANYLSDDREREIGKIIDTVGIELTNAVRENRHNRR